MELRINRFIPYTRVEGPGERACIWVQGCPTRCPGCAVPGTWPKEGGEMVDTDNMAQRILKGPKIEGITFLGGEPFEQAAALAILGKSLQDAGLSVVTFTGYLLQDIINSGRKEWLNLVAVTDLLIDGPYRQDFADLSRPWVGSANQCYHFLTDRYSYLESDLQKIPNRLEIRIHTNGTILINGEGDIKALRNILD